MTVLDLFNPTLSRSFIYYDQCAIALDADELVATRIRVSVNILASPVGRSRNLKYPYHKEFFGYCQTFWQNTLLDEYPINYVSQFLIDHWNQHATLAHQITEVLDRSGFISESDIRFLIDTYPDYPRIADLAEALLKAVRIAACFKIDLPGGESFINTFNLPFNLLRFKFPFGTVFNVTIDTWTMIAGEDSDFLPGNPNTSQPYDTDNPNGNSPDQTPGNRNPEQPYGPNPPESSPLDPDLDPNDFSNAPEPEPPEPRVSVRGWFLPAIPGAQSEGYVIAGSDVASLQDVPGFAFASGEADLGTACVLRDSNGGADGNALSAAYPGFLPGIHTNSTGPSSPSC